MERIRKQKKASKKTDQTSTESVSKTEVSEDLKVDTDALLDEIDQILEQNAVDFVRDYVQKGGE